MADKKLKVTWVRSTISTKKDHRATIRALGFKRLNQSIEKTDNPQIRGMLRLVDYLVKVEEA